MENLGRWRFVFLQHQPRLVSTQGRQVLVMMAKTFNSRWVGLLLCFGLLARSTSAQSPSIQIQPDIRIFAVLAALQEAGLGANAPETHPSRAAISREFQAI